MKNNMAYKCVHCNSIVYRPEPDRRFCSFCGREWEKDSLTLNEEIEKEVYEWLSKELRIDNWLVSETVRNQLATVFLLIWPIIENRIFFRNVKQQKARDISERIKGNIDDNKLNPIVFHFYERYQDTNKYNKLVNGREWDGIKDILNTPFSMIGKADKIYFAIFVVYRYRNNIFHGLKSITEWNAYADEIQLCIEFMLMFGKCTGRNGSDKRGFLHKDMR